MNWIFSQKTSGVLIVIPDTVEIEVGVGVELASGVVKGIGDTAGGGCQVASEFVPFNWSFLRDYRATILTFSSCHPGPYVYAI